MLLLFLYRQVKKPKHNEDYFVEDAFEIGRQREG